MKEVDTRPDGQNYNSEQVTRGDEHVGKVCNEFSKCFKGQFMADGLDQGFLNFAPVSTN